MDFSKIAIYYRQVFRGFKDVVHRFAFCTVDLSLGHYFVQEQQRVQYVGKEEKYLQ